MTTIRTVADLKAFLEQFSDDTLVEFSHGRYSDSITTNFPGADSPETQFGWSDTAFAYGTAQPERVYVPSEQAVRSAQENGWTVPVARTFPAHPAMIRFGSEE